MGTRLLSATAATVLAAAVLVPSGGAAAAAAGGLSVALVTPQTVTLDPRAVQVNVSYTVSDCAQGCDLVRVEALRANYDEEVVDSRTFAPSATPRTFTVRDTIDDDPAFGESIWYEVRRAAADGSWNLVALHRANLAFGTDAGFTYGSGWRRDVSLNSTETMIERSATRGAVASLPAADEARQVGIVSARGPRNGVMAIAVDGRVVKTLDLRAARWQPRQVVAAVPVPAGARLTVTNATPAARSGKDVHVDGFVALAAGADPIVAGSPTRAGADQIASDQIESAAATGAASQAAPRETITARVAAPQQLAAGSGTFRVDVVARVLGCPKGCSLIASTVEGVEKVLLTKTSPASATLQTLRTTVGGTEYTTYRLEKGGTPVAQSPAVSPVVERDSVLTYSWGWTRDANRTATDGTIMRSSTGGTGATYRVAGTFSGRSIGLVAAKGPRNGVVAVYADGVLKQTVDLRASRWQPRQVVAAVDLPVMGRITLVNVTPSGRANADVHVDGLVVLDQPDDWY